DGTAILGGTPESGSAGVYTFDIVADNGSVEATQEFTLVVDEDPAFLEPRHAYFVAGTEGTFTGGTRGTPVPSIYVDPSSNDLPDGIEFTDNQDGTFSLSGTPTTPGTYQVILTAANGIGDDSTQTFTLTVAENATETSISEIDPSPIIAN